MSGPFRVRPLEPGDREACLRLFDSHAPRAFRPEERPGFEDVLTDPPGPVVVVELEGEGVVACGGDIDTLRLETIPATVGFFRHMGFEVVLEEPDGYGPGLPRVELRRSIHSRETP